MTYEWFKQHIEDPQVDAETEAYIRQSRAVRVEHGIFWTCADCGTAELVSERERRCPGCGAAIPPPCNPPAEQIDIPKDRETVHYHPEDSNECGMPCAMAALERGAMVEFCGEQGVVRLWKQDAVYRAVVMSWRRVAENRTFDAIEPCQEWFWDAIGQYL